MRISFTRVADASVPTLKPGLYGVLAGVSVAGPPETLF